jgi:hypothetical protein
MKIMNQVENILKVSQAARNSDKDLLVIYMQKMGMRLSLEQIAIFRKMPSTETIRRSRQAIQEQGRYLPSKEVEEMRFKKFQEVKGGIGLVEPEVLLEKQGYVVRPWGE